MVLALIPTGLLITSLQWVGTSLRRTGHMRSHQFLLLCGSAASVVGISGRFSSSSLPPSFPRGRRTADVFCPPALRVQA